ncbi:MAG: hypothetical protein WCC04_20610 [Terriglobales bacterium]
MTDKELERLVENWFSTGTRIIHPVFPAYLKSGEKVEFEHRSDGWYWSTSTEEKGPFKDLSLARDDRTKSAEQTLEAERRGTL